LALAARKLMEAAEQNLLATALRFALAAHAGQKRRGSAAPYATHLLQVAGLVIEHGGDSNQAAAALLHDTLEDCEGVTEAVLREHFGAEIAEMVCALSDLLPGDTPARKSPWRERKLRYVQRLAALDARTRLVAACDKLDNLRGLVADLEAEGEVVWKRFRGAPPQTRWFYESACAHLRPGLPQRLLSEQRRLLAALARYVPEAAPP